MDILNDRRKTAEKILIENIHPDIYKKYIIGKALYSNSLQIETLKAIAKEFKPNE